MYNFIETDSLIFGVGLSFLFGFEINEDDLYFNFGPFYLVLDMGD